ncbi:MAG: hypothetical protein HN548_00390 [Opitutae bacterium]|jgi:hypothetical protein|nr:hypothetical protein [Opitutae bacterium]
MSTVDQFESVFKAAAKTTYSYKKPPLNKVLLVTDMVKDQATLYLNLVRAFLDESLSPNETEWVLLSESDFETVKDLLEKVELNRPDLIVTYRHLKSESWRWPYSLGEHLDVLTQVTETPVLVIPHPDRDDSSELLSTAPKKIMAVSSHICGEGTLVNYASAFTPKDGSLSISHIEDKSTLDRYLDAIDKIPDIDSEVARETLLNRLLKDAKDFSESAKECLVQAGLGIKVECNAQLGSQLEDYRKLIEDGEVDLLVMHAKEDDQLAMHGMAHPLVVELRSVPILLL